MVNDATEVVEQEYANELPDYEKAKTNLEKEVKTNRSAWRLKLILTDMQADDRVPFFMKPFVAQASRVMKVFEILNQQSASLFGIVHAALLVGPWILDWNRDSLVVYRLSFLTKDSENFLG